MIGKNAKALGLGLLATSLILAACGTAAPGTPVVVEKEKIVEKVVTSAPQVVKETVVVAAPTPNLAATTAAAGSAKAAAAAKVKETEALLRSSVKALDSAGQPCKDYAQEDCLTLKIKLNAPTPFFHTIMGLWVAYPAKEENIAAGKEDQWMNSSKFQVGNGPYLWKTLEPQVKARFEPNANYYGDKAKTAVEFSFIADSAVSFNAYKNNEFDIVGLAAEDYKTIQADAALSKQATIYPGSCTQQLAMNNKFPPYDDKQFRAAVAQAFDRKAYVDNILQGLGAPTLTWIPPGYPGYDKDENRFQFNVDEAKKALAASKAPTADKVPGGKLKYFTSNTPRNKTRAEFIVQMLSKNLGMPIETVLVDPTEYTARQKKGDMDGMFIQGWCADFPHQTNWLPTYFNSKSFASRWGYTNPANDKLMSDADQTVDATKAAAMYAQAQKTIVGDVSTMMMYNTVNQYLIKPWVTGIIKTPQDSGWAGDTVPTSIDLDLAAIPGAPKSKTLRVNLATYPDMLDPQKASFVNEIAHLKLAYEGLTKFDKDLNTVPGAAEKWTYNEAGTELTFTLRKGLKYSDGSPLNAKRFEYSIIRNVDPNTAGEYAFVTNDYIVGANAWNEAVAAAAAIK